MFTATFPACFVDLVTLEAQIEIRLVFKVSQKIIIKKTFILREK